MLEDDRRSSSIAASSELFRCSFSLFFFFLVVVRGKLWRETCIKMLANLCNCKQIPGVGIGTWKQLCEDGWEIVHYVILMSWLLLGRFLKGERPHRQRKGEKFLAPKITLTKWIRCLWHIAAGNAIHMWSLLGLWKIICTDIRIMIAKIVWEMREITSTKLSFNHLFILAAFQARNWLVSAWKDDV